MKDLIASELVLTINKLRTELYKHMENQYGSSDIDGMDGDINECWVDKETNGFHSLWIPGEYNIWDDIQYHYENESEEDQPLEYGVNI